MHGLIVSCSAWLMGGVRVPRVEAWMCGVVGGWRHVIKYACVAVGHTLDLRPIMSPLSSRPRKSSSPGAYDGAWKMLEQTNDKVLVDLAGLAPQHHTHHTEQAAEPGGGVGVITTGTGYGVHPSSFFCDNSRIAL
eukprot:scaffold5128_cov104-Isochrysis_galbana.AAC.8